MGKTITEKEIELFLKNDGADAFYDWAVNQFKEENEECYDLAIKLYELAAEHNHAHSLNNLGALYAEGRFVKKDTQKALELYLIAAQNGSAEACCNLGYFYFYGKNGEVDYGKAFEYFSRGATLGNDANCLYKLGDMYMFGIFVDKNPKIAVDFYIKAFEEYECNYICEFLSDIEYRLGKCYYEGNGVETDWYLANEYLNRALDGYKNREHDAYDYVQKRIEEIEKLLSDCESALPKSDTFFM